MVCQSFLPWSIFIHTVFGNWPRWKEMYNKSFPKWCLKKKEKKRCKRVAGFFISWNFFFFSNRIIVCSMVLEAYSYNQSLGTGNSCWFVHIEVSLVFKGYIVNKFSLTNHLSETPMSSIFYIYKYKYMFFKCVCVQAHKIQIKLELQKTIRFRLNQGVCLKSFIYNCVHLKLAANINKNVFRRLKWKLILH